MKDEKVFLVIQDYYNMSKIFSNYLEMWGYNPFVTANEYTIANYLQAMELELKAVLIDVTSFNNAKRVIQTVIMHPSVYNIPVIMANFDSFQRGVLLGEMEYFQNPDEIFSKEKKYIEDFHEDIEKILQIKVINS